MEEVKIAIKILKCYPEIAKSLNNKDWGYEDIRFSNSTEESIYRTIKETLPQKPAI
jgi:hypothetical protein